MDHPTLEDKQILERYLLGQLSPEEAELLEEHLLYCHRCQDRLEATEGMLEGLRTVASEDAATASRLGILAWLARRGRLARATLLAVLVLAILGPSAYLWQRAERAESALAEARRPSPAMLLSLAAQRSPGGEPSHRVNLGEGASWVVLSLELDALTAERYELFTVTLTGPHGHELWSAEDLMPDHRESLPLALPTSILAPGVYELRVDAQPTDPRGEPTPVGRYAFRAVD